MWKKRHTFESIFLESFSFALKNFAKKFQYGLYTIYFTNRLWLASFHFSFSLSLLLFFKQKSWTKEKQGKETFDSEEERRIYSVSKPIKYFEESFECRPTNDNEKPYPRDCMYIFNESVAVERRRLKNPTRKFVHPFAAIVSHCNTTWPQCLTEIVTRRCSRSKTRREKKPRKPILCIVVNEIFGWHSILW